MSEKLLQGKTVLITGGTRGIGEAIVHECAAQGARVAFTYAGSTAKAQELETQLAQAGVQAISFQADAADFARAQEVADAVVEKFGTLDVLINNAGITRDNLLLRMGEDQWDEVLDKNLKSVFNYTKAVAKPMMKARTGSIINMSSVVGVNGNAGQANYAASKAGILGFTKSIAKELASRNIRCNAVAPGFIATEMTEQIPQAELAKWLENIPMKRAGTPQEVARLCTFLGSDWSAYITGQVILIDGGMS
ncbi:MAG: 3-oxoacyl-[acyl-carrier-protein] reductase [Bacteroidetes bacterium]|nr:3-oxoacyl-[acyl-carrier-protein] reductase [Bacteroidota bacterium]